MKKNSTASFTTIVSLTRKLSLSLLLVGCFQSLSWGQVKKVEIIDQPTIKDDRVTLRVKATQDGDRPALELTDSDFKLLVDKKELEIKPKDWKSPQESVPPPAWIVVLLDMSGSMAAPDSQGTSKLEGAIQAIREFTKQAAERGGNTQVAIVPFGEPGENCAGYEVNAQTIDKFFPAGDFKLQNYLDYLQGNRPCASTNLYDPIKKTTQFLTNPDDPRFTLPEDSSLPQPRLSIILVSDGYHNKPNEQQDFDALTRLLKSSEKLTVHTLGYGLTAQQLGQKYKLGKPATRSEVSQGKVPEDEFVDQKRLAAIAQSTGGISEFSGNAEEIAKSLTLFLNSLLGEYEISYNQPSAERGSKHQVVVEVKSPKETQPVKSEAADYTITVFGRSVPLKIRLLVLILTLITIGVGGVLPFYYWGQHLKEEATD